MKGVKYMFKIFFGVLLALIVFEILKFCFKILFKKIILNSFNKNIQKIFPLDDTDNNFWEE